MAATVISNTPVISAVDAEVSAISVRLRILKSAGDGQGNALERRHVHFTKSRKSPEKPEPGAVRNRIGRHPLK